MSHPGTVPPAQRQSIIDRFNESDNDTQFLMLISTKAGTLPYAPRAHLASPPPHAYIRLALTHM